MQFSHHKTLHSGRKTSHWQLEHVSLDATKDFQVEFEVRKGAGSSMGGFSIDDINLSEIECPHVTMQVNDFENVLETSSSGTIISSPRHYSRGGYAYSVGIVLYRRYFGVFVQLLSGDYDDILEWPCPQRQVTFQVVDQNPHIQLQMSKQRSVTSDLTQSGVNGKNSKKSFKKMTSDYFSTPYGIVFPLWYLECSIMLSINRFLCLGQSSRDWSSICRRV